MSSRWIRNLLRAWPPLGIRAPKRRVDTYAELPETPDRLESGRANFRAPAETPRYNR